MPIFFTPSKSDDGKLLPKSLFDYKYLLLSCLTILRLIRTNRMNLNRFIDWLIWSYRNWSRKHIATMNHKFLHLISQWYVIKAFTYGAKRSIKYELRIIESHQSSIRRQRFQQSYIRKPGQKRNNSRGTTGNEQAGATAIFNRTPR